VALDRLAAAVVDLPSRLVEGGVFPLAVAGLSLFRCPTNPHHRNNSPIPGHLLPSRLRGDFPNLWETPSLVALHRREKALVSRWNLEGHPFLRLTLVAPPYALPPLLEVLAPLQWGGELDLTLTTLRGRYDPNSLRRALLHPLLEGRLEGWEGLSQQLTRLRGVETPRFAAALPAFHPSEPVPSWLESLSNA